MPNFKVYAPFFCYILYGIGFGGYKSLQLIGYVSDFWIMEIFALHYDHKLADLLYLLEMEFRFFLD